MTDQEIQELITSPKKIKKREPVEGYNERDSHRRCNLVLEDASGDERVLSVFIRQNIFFIENFSIGLVYKTKDKALGSITLVRYNGPHGETSRNMDGHYAKSHIHCITAEEVQSGIMQPQEKHREITERYSTFEGALKAFFDDGGIVNGLEYFPKLSQMGLFDGHQ